MFEFKFKYSIHNGKTWNLICQTSFPLFFGYLRLGRPEYLRLLNGRSYFHCRMVFRVTGRLQFYDSCSSFFASATQHDLFLIIDINAACFEVNCRQNNYDHKGIKYYLLSSGNTTINALRRLAVSIANLSRCLASNVPAFDILFHLLTISEHLSVANVDLIN